MKVSLLIIVKKKCLENMRVLLLIFVPPLDKINQTNEKVRVEFTIRSHTHVPSSRNQRKGWRSVLATVERHGLFIGLGCDLCTLPNFRGCIFSPKSGRQAARSGSGTTHRVRDLPLISLVPLTFLK